MTAEFSAEQAQARLPELLQRAGAGEDIVITRPGADPVLLRRTPGSREFPLEAPAAGAAGERGFDVGTDYSPAELGLRG